MLVVTGRLPAVTGDISTATPVTAGTASPNLRSVYVGTLYFQPLSTSVNLSSTYSRAAMAKVCLSVSSCIEDI